MMSFEEAKQVVQAIRDMDHGKYVVIREIAAEDLSQDWPEGEGMGSSDVSIHLIEMVRRGDIKEALQ